MFGSHLAAASILNAAPALIKQRKERGANGFSGDDGSTGVKYQGAIRVPGVGAVYAAHKARAGVVSRTHYGQAHEGGGFGGDDIGAEGQAAALGAAGVEEAPVHSAQLREVG